MIHDTQMNNATNTQVAAFLRKVIPLLSEFQKKDIGALKSTFSDIFEESWGNYFYGKWQGEKKAAQIPSWVVLMDAKHQKTLVGYLLGRQILNPPINEISNFAKNVGYQTGAISDADFQEIQRAISPIEVESYAWEVVALQKFCLYTLNNDMSAQKVGKKRMDIFDWHWSAYFMHMETVAQEDFAEIIMKYK